MSKNNTAKKNAAAEKLAALKAKVKGKADAKPETKAKVLDLKEKLKGKKASTGPVSCITNPKEKEKLARFGIECVVVHDADLGEDAAEVRVDGDLVTITQSDRADAVAIAMGLYAHVKKMAEKLAKQMNEE